MLDIEVAGSVAPARIVVYFAPNTDQGFHDAITTAVHDTANNPSVISISWGGPEDLDPQAATMFEACEPRGGRHDNRRRGRQWGHRWRTDGKLTSTCPRVCLPCWGAAAPI